MVVVPELPAALPPRLLSRDRRCCGLDWASRHLHRTVPGIHRVMRLRRIAGINPHPFAPIPKRSPRHKRYTRLVARILVEERHLVQVLGHVNATSIAIARLRGMLPKPRRVATKR